MDEVVSVSSNLKRKDRQTAHNHPPRRTRSLDRRLILIRLPRRTVLSRQRNRRPNVQTNRHQQNNPRHPHTHPVPHRMQQLRILIERPLTHENQQIARQVTRQEQHQQQPRKGDDDFFPDGGLPVGGEAAGKGVHDENGNGGRCRARNRHTPQPFQGQQWRRFSTRL